LRISAVTLLVVLSASTLLVGSSHPALSGKGAVPSSSTSPSGSTSHSSPLSRLQNAREAIVVTTPDWNSSSGTLQRYERNHKRWKPVGDSIPVVIGTSGMGWASEFLPKDQAPDGPVKKEGDGRSPAGVFKIGAAFGYDDVKPDWLKLPYIPLTSATECVDDATSEYYNSVVDRTNVANAGWNSSEKMRQIGAYRWGVIVDQNPERQRGAGSCIFLHTWKGLGSSTAGCTAMDQGQLEKVMTWLNPADRPVMVTLPEAEYKRLRAEWRLP